MQRIVKIWNRKTTDHVERYKDDIIRIPAGKYVEMDREDAIQFCGQYYPPKFDGNKVQKPESFKMLEIEGKYGPARPIQVQNNHKCMACGHVCLSARELSAHTEEHHADQFAKDDEAEAEISANQTKTSFVSEEALAAQVKKSPGRPRKEM
jgi:hypothetical protein